MGDAAQEPLKCGRHSSIALRVLGPLEAYRDGEAVRLGGAKERALLAVLLLHPTELVTRERLIEELWHGEPPATAEHALEVYVSNLRRTLGRDVIATRPGGYVLAVDPEAIDSVRFERLVERGRAQLATDVSAAAETLREALALWRGPALADFAYEPFAQSEIGRLDEVRLTCLEDRFEADMRLGRHAPLIAELETAAAEHPLRERLRAQLMLALYRSGRQADALQTYRAARASLLEDLGLDVSVELRGLQAAILRQDSSLDVEPAELVARRHLPAPATPFVGRRAELAAVLACLRDGAARIVTLSGPGGTGKTRLALRAAHELASSYDDGVYFVDLAAVADPALLHEAIAAALQLTDAAPVEAYVAPRRVLLVLDNFEQIDAAAPFVAQLVRGAPQLAVIVTSRVPLRIYGEYVFAVPPLAREDAAALFIARAAAAGRALEPSPEIDDVCDWLDRLPLAIELVAARTREVSPRQVLEALPPRLEVATQGPRDVPARQQTLRATIEWSVGLLGDRERTVLRRVAVFHGGFTPGAAQAVCGAELAELAALVDASLLVEPAAYDREPRVSLLQTIQEYALEQLEQSGEGDVLRGKHAQYFAELAERAEPELLGAAEGWLERLEADHDNLRAALDWMASEAPGEAELRIAVALRRFWYVRGHTREARRRLESALLHAENAPPALRATAAGAAGLFAVVRSDYEQGTAWTKQSLELFRSLGDGAGVTRSLSRLADIAKAEGRSDAAAAYYASALRVARVLDDKRPLAEALINAGAFELLRRNPRKTQRLTSEALGIWRELGHTEGIAIALSNLGLAAIEGDDFVEALSFLEEGAELARQLGFTSHLLVTLLAAAIVAARTGAPDRAARLIAALDELLDTTDARLSPQNGRYREEVIDAYEAALTEAQAVEEGEAGRSMSLAEAIDYGLAIVRAAARDRRPGATDH